MVAGDGMRGGGKNGGKASTSFNCGGSRAQSDAVPDASEGD